jgi:hypothetical protein
VIAALILTVFFAGLAVLDERCTDDLEPSGMTELPRTVQSAH